MRKRRTRSLARCMISMLCTPRAAHAARKHEDGTLTGDPGREPDWLRGRCMVLAAASQLPLFPLPPNGLRPSSPDTLPAVVSGLQRMHAPFC